MGIDQAIDITGEQRKTILALLERHLPNTTAWVYGSRAKWTSRPQSDLDFVVFATPEQARQVSDLREVFEESNLPFRVDLFVWDDVPESFRRQIEAEHVVLVERQERGIANEWSTATIEEIAEKVAMGPFGSSIKVETFVPNGVPIISGQHLHGTRVDDIPGFNFITPEHADRLANANVRRGDIVFTHRGNIGQVAYILEDSRFDRYIVSQSQFYVRCDRSKAIPEFVTMYFKSAEGQHQLLANSSHKVGVPSIARPVTYLRTIKLPLPPLPEQRAIAHVLGTLDDKIELNRRMNETLEEMARALFKSWFVDFLPVRAKMAAKQNNPSLLLPQAESGTWFVYAIECADGSLYIGQTENLRQRWLQHSSSKGGRWTKSHPPQRVAYWEKQPSRQAAVEREKWLKTGFGRKWLKKEIATRTQTGDPVRAKMAGRDTGLPPDRCRPLSRPARGLRFGPIPEGWEIGCFGDIVDQVLDKENPLASPDTDFRHFSIPAFDKDRWPQTERGENIKSQKSRVPPGVILLSKLNPEIERVWFVDVASDERAICSTEFLVLQARLPFQRNYVYCLTRSPFFRQQIGSLVTGTSKSHQRAQAGAVLALEATIPPAPVIRAFDQQASTLLNKSLGYLRETTTLIALRDALLPKLVSRELRVGTD